MKLERARFLQENMDIFSRTDRIFLNNPVVMQGMGMAPLVVAATTGQNAMMIALAVILLATPTRVLGSLLMHALPHRFSIWYYAGIACLLYVPAYIFMFDLFGRSIYTVGIYLPLLVMDPLVMRRYAVEKAERPARALSRGISSTAGYCIVLMITGCLREFLALGSIFGNTITASHWFPLAGRPAGGLIFVGALCAIWRGCIARYKKYVNMEAGRVYE